jgi:hypothetical protein
VVCPRGRAAGRPARAPPARLRHQPARLRHQPAPAGTRRRGRAAPHARAVSGARHAPTAPVPTAMPTRASGPALPVRPGTGQGAASAPKHRPCPAALHQDLPFGRTFHTEGADSARPTAVVGDKVGAPASVMAVSNLLCA